MKILIPFVVFFSLTFVAAVPDFAQEIKLKDLPSNPSINSVATTGTLVMPADAILEISDFHFGYVDINKAHFGYIVIRNIGTVNVQIAGATPSANGYFWYQPMDLICSIIPGDSVLMSVSFYPTNVQYYEIQISLFVAPEVDDRIITITGFGREPVSVATTENPRDNVIAFPNPASDVVILRSDLFSAPTYTVTITNAIGGEVQRQSFSVANNEVRIPTGNLPHGVYLCTITSGSTNVGSVKFVR